MLPTFVIGLREGLEAALIVGIIAAFLRKQGRRDLLRWVLAGVAVAIGLCLAGGIALHVYSQNLPQKQQEGLETVIGVLAIGMVTYMVVWMRRNSRNLKGQLEGMAADALTAKSSTAGRAGRAMVVMAFLAVIREGVETVVFVLAAFNEAGSGSTAGFGLLLGIAIAVAMGYGIYRGGVRINLSKFFRATGIVLVLVAAGILVNALHTAHEAGWLNVGQNSPVDLTWLVEPGTVQASLLTGMLGIQPHPALIEIVAWLAYLIPVGLYVAWPPGKAAPARALARGAAMVGVLAGVAALVLVLVAPSTPTARPTTSGGKIAAQVTSRTGAGVVLDTQAQQPVKGTVGERTAVRLRAAGRARHAGLDTDVYRAERRGTGASGRPAALTPGQLSAINGNRLPIGLGSANGASGSAALPATYADTVTITAWLDQRTDRVVDLVWSEQVTVSVRARSGAVITLPTPVAAARVALPGGVATAAAAAARDAHADLDRRDTLHVLAAWCLVLAVLALALAAGFGLAGRRWAKAAEPAVRPDPTLVRS